MARKLFPYGKFIGLDTITTPANMNARYVAHIENAYVDFRGQLRSMPGHLGTLHPGGTQRVIDGVTSSTPSENTAYHAFPLDASWGLRVCVDYANVGNHNSGGYDYVPNGNTRSFVTYPWEIGDDRMGEIFLKEHGQYGNQPQYTHTATGGSTIIKVTSASFDDFWTARDDILVLKPGDKMAFWNLSATSANYGGSNSTWDVDLNYNLNGGTTFEIIEVRAVGASDDYFTYDSTVANTLSVGVEGTGPSDGGYSTMGSWRGANAPLGRTRYHHVGVKQDGGDTSLRLYWNGRGDWSSGAKTIVYRGDLDGQGGASSSPYLGGDYSWDWIEGQDNKGDSYGNQRLFSHYDQKAANSDKTTHPYYTTASDANTVPLIHTNPQIVGFDRKQWVFMKGWDAWVYDKNVAADTSRWNLASHQPITAYSVTMTIASPCVVTYTDHKLAVGDAISFSTSGALPTGLLDSTDVPMTTFAPNISHYKYKRAKTYWVQNVIDANTFHITATPGDAALATTGSQSGTHYLHCWNSLAAFPRGGIAVTILNRLVVADIYNKETEIHVSRPDAPYDWRVDTSGGGTPLSTDGLILDVKNQFSGQDKIVGLGVLEGDKLVIFGQNEILVYLANADITKWAIATDFRLNIGLHGRNTITRIGQDLFFCSKFGLHSIRRAASGLTLESSTYSAPISNLWEKVLGENALTDIDVGSTGTERTGWERPYSSSVPNFYQTEPEAYFDADMGQYHLLIPTGDDESAVMTFTYDPNIGQRGFQGWAFAPTNIENPRVGSYGMTNFSRTPDDTVSSTEVLPAVWEWRTRGIANVILGCSAATTSAFRASGAIAREATDRGGITIMRSPILWLGTPDRYKYFRRMIIRATQSNMAENISSGPSTANMNVMVHIYDEHNNLRLSTQFTPAFLGERDGPATTTTSGIPDTSSGIIDDFKPNTRYSSDDDVGAGVGWSDSFSGERSPIEIPIAVRAKGISVVFGITAKDGSPNVGGELVISDYGFIADVK